MVLDSNQNSSMPLTMSLSEKNKRRIWWICACLLPLLYFFLYAPYGFEDKDTGFILGNAWQVFCGARLYTDVIYIRPPVSVLFHLLPLWVSINHALMVDRLLFYLEVWVYSALTVGFLGKAFRIECNRHLVFLAALSFMLSVHNFPPMAWHTVDGLFFCTIGLVLAMGAERPVPMRSLLGGGILALGVLCKQSFYLMPLGLLAYLLINRQFAKAGYAFAGLLVVFILFGVWLSCIGSLHAFVEMTSGQTTVSDLLKIGFQSYCKKIGKIPAFFGPPLLLVLLARRYAKQHVKAIGFFSLFLTVLLYALVQYIRKAAFIAPPGHFPDVLFIGVFLFMCWKWAVERGKRHLPCMVFLLLSWSASISWGYSSTALFFAPVVFVFGLLMKDAMSAAWVRWASMGLLVLTGLVFWTAYQTPYTLDHRALRRSDLCCDMEQVSPRLMGIRADRDTYEEYKELKELLQRHGNHFAVFPSCTLAHFITGTQNPIGADWVLNTEINERSDLLIQRLERHCPVVFVERRKISSDGKWGSFITTHVVKEWQQVEEGKYFDVYKCIGVPVKFCEVSPQSKGMVK